jgi:hypothetical protein
MGRGGIGFESVRTSANGTEGFAFIFSVPYRQISGQWLKVCHDRSFSNQFQFTNRPTARSYVVKTCLEVFVASSPQSTVRERI